jgi:hypothetical protein
MAELYAGKKFDDANVKVDASADKVYPAFQKEAMRRALQGISNRVIGGTSGTQGPLVVAGCALGTTAGFKTANDVTVIIDGVKSVAIAQDNLTMPTGTMGTNTVAKFLICTGTGTSGTILEGNVVDKGDYATVALAAAAAKLPDLPDGYCALGYVTLNAPTATALGWTPSTGFITGTGGTAGTAAYVDLNCMPYDL